MSLHVKHKSLIAFLASTAILFATLFAVTALELKDRNLTLKSQDSSQYLRAEEAIIVIPQVEEFAVSPNDSDPTEEEAEGSVAGKETEQEPEEEILKIERTLFEYIEVADSCNHKFEND